MDSGSRHGPMAAGRTTSVHATAEAFVREFISLLEEGWNPDLEEFVRRVPEDFQEAVFEEIDRELANRGSTSATREDRVVLPMPPPEDATPRDPDSAGDAVREDEATDPATAAMPDHEDAVAPQDDGEPGQDDGGTEISAALYKLLGTDPDAQLETPGIRIRSTAAEFAEDVATPDEPAQAPEMPGEGPEDASFQNATALAATLGHLFDQAPAASEGPAGTPSEARIARENESRPGADQAHELTEPVSETVDDPEPGTPTDLEPEGDPAFPDDDPTTETVEAPPPETESEYPVPELAGLRVERTLRDDARATTYAAWEESGNRRVVLRVMRSSDEAARHRLQDAALKPAVLADPEIVGYEAVYEDPAGPVLVRSYAEGLPLLDAAAVLKIRERTELLARAAEALGRLHAAGLIHGNLKPGNVFVTAAGEIRYVDAGLGPAPQPGRPGRRHADALPEVHGYLSPEQAEGRGPRASADVYGLGAMIYHAVTGRSPFGTTNPKELAQEINNGDVTPPRQIEHSLPRDLEAVCLSCLARNPRARPEAAQVAEELLRIVAGRGVRLRPARFLRDLKRDVQDRAATVAVWRERGLIGSRAATRLMCLDRTVQAREERWRLHRDRLRRTDVVLHAGNALVVAACGLIAWSGPVGWLACVPAGAALLLTAAALHATLRREPAATTSYFTAAAAAAAPGALALLAWQGIAVGAGPGFLPAWGAPAWSFAQLGIAALGVFGLCVAAAFTTRHAHFAWGAVVGLAGGSAAWIASSDLAFRVQLACGIPLAGALGLAVFAERRRRDEWRAPTFSLGLAALLALPVGIAMGGNLFDGARIDPWLGGVDFGFGAMALLGIALLWPVGAVLRRRRALTLQRTADVSAALAPCLVWGASILNASAVGGIQAAVLPGLCAAVLLVLAASRGRRPETAGTLRLLVTGLGCLVLATTFLAARAGLDVMVLLPVLAGAGALASIGTYLLDGRG